MRYGVREICDVVFRARAKMQLGNRTFYKNDPVIYFDTLKTSSLEGASTTVYATGSRGNARLIAWDGERTLTFNMEDALISPESLSILAASGLTEASDNKPVYIHTTSTVTVEKDKTNTIKLPGIYACHPNGTGTPATGTKLADLQNKNADIFCMILDDNGQVVTEPCVPASVTYDENGTTIVCYADGKTGHTDLPAGSIVLVDYYVCHASGVKVIEITPEIKGQNFYIEASTLFRDEASGQDMPAEFVIPNGKVQSNFTFSMASSGDPSTFSFVVDAFPAPTKFDPTKKVLAALYVVEGDADEDNKSREKCDATAAAVGG